VEPPAQRPPAEDRADRSPLSPAAAAALPLALTAGVVLSWSVPILGVVLVWPWLLAVPGWVVVRRVAPTLPRPGSVGVAVVASAYLSAHLVDLISRVDGFGRAAVLIAAALLAVGTVVFARIEHPWLAPLELPALRQVPRSLRDAVRDDPAAWLIAGTVSGVILFILGTNGWHDTEAGFVSGGWNWSDFLVHVSIGNSLVHGNYPPQVPYAAGEPLTYHWFADFHGAILATASGLPIIPVFIVSSALFAGVLALLVWALTIRLTDRPRVAAIATVLVCFGGGMGWLRLVGDLLAGGSDIATLVTNQAYDNSWADGWPYFRIASVLGTGFLPHRATTFGLPGLVAAVLLVVACLGRRPAGMLFAGVLAALLAPFQFYAFPATYLIVGLYVLTTRGWRSPTIVRDALLFLVPMVVALPYIAPAIARQSDLGSFRLVGGWSEARFSDGPAAVAFFYLTNLGLPVILAVVSAVAARRVPARAFLVAWMVGLFLVPNVVVVSAVEFDMNKYFQMMWIPVAILAAWLIRDWPAIATIGVLAFSALSPTLVGIWHATSPTVALGHAQEAAARWIETNTPERSVFVTDAFINSPVDLAGRLRITSFGPYVANLGYDPAPREADVRAIYCDGPDVAAERMAIYAATYVVSSGGSPGCDDDVLTDFDASERFETVYAADGVTIWRLVDG
jgi:hypothetical protein